VLRNQLDKLRKKFQVALERNVSAPAEEKVPRLEFVVEFEKRDRLVAERDRQVAALQERTHKQNLGNTLLRSDTRKGLLYVYFTYILCL
jgi:hypothetical protein